MACHQFLDRPHDIYPRDEWAIVEKQFNPDFLPMMESIFSLRPRCWVLSFMDSIKSTKDFKAFDARAGRVLSMAIDD